MSEADYAFKPVDTVRSFGEILSHIAGANYVICAPARGDKTEYEEDRIEKTAKTKEEIVKALNESLAYCDAAYNALTDKSAAETSPAERRACAAADRQHHPSPGALRQPGHLLQDQRHGAAEQRPALTP
jgi:hypothetical protein